MLGHIPLPLLSRAGSGNVLSFDNFGVTIRPEDSSIGLGRDGKTYVRIPMPRKRNGAEHFEPAILSAATVWTRYGREAAPDVYKFFEEGETPITDFYMARFLTTTGSCIAVY